MKHTTACDEMQGQAALYALGALDHQEARAVEEHLSEGCETCEAELQPFVSVAEVLAMAAPEVSPPTGAREKFLARLAEEARPDTSRELLQQAESNPFLTIRATEGKWVQASESLSIKQLFVDEAKGTVTSLYKLAPGGQLPVHRHLGVEECYVLEGDCRINDQVLYAGDYTCAMKGSVHQTVYTETGTLLLIIAQEGCEVMH
jgi:anti-sigma factor ChrR (cupin superfamily)